MLKVTADSKAIITLCSRLCVEDGAVPLEPREYDALASRLAAAGKTPGDIFDMSASDLYHLLNGIDALCERLKRLTGRLPLLLRELDALANLGIRAITLADAHYPDALKKKLAASAPPIFYYAGDIELASRPVIGFVGSRDVERRDVEFTEAAVRKAASLGFGVVSGGARGVDTVAETEAISSGAFCVEFSSDSIVKKLGRRDTAKAVRDGRLLLLSSVGPDTGFSAGIAMMRNRYIYALSEATVAVRSDLNRGGTWAGATDALRHSLCPVLCRDHPYPGNLALIEKGAVPIGADWDGSFPAKLGEQDESEYEQTSLFDLRA